MKKITIVLMIIVSVMTLTSCTSFNPQKIGWGNTMSKYVYEELNKNKDKEIIVHIEDIFMINAGRYLAKAYMGDEYKNPVSGTYDLTINVGEVDFSDTNSDYSAAISGEVIFYTTEPVINYTTEESSYLVIKDNGKRGYYKTPIYETKIYIPKKSLKSMPYNKGKFGSDPNIKIN